MGSSTPPPLLLLLLFLSLCISSHAKLTLDYYAKTCPQFEEIVRETAIDKQRENPTVVAGTLRVFFHDCFISGCDASVLVASNAFNKAERDAEPNINLSADAFDVVNRAKTNLELTCPGVVSCADILAQVTRDLLRMTGAPFYEVRLGRKDATFSNVSDVEGNIPVTATPMDEVVNMFKSRGFTEQELVALIGSHTIGFSHCKEFAGRIFNYSKTSDVDPTLNPQYANRLKTFCANYHEKPTMAAFNDVITPGKFDNMYYQNLKRGLGLLPIDLKIHTDPRTAPWAERYAANQTEFFEAFSRAIEKLGRLGVKIGNQGEVRHKCDAINNLKVN